MLATRSDSAKSKTNSDLAIDFFLIEHCLIGIGIKIGIKIGIGGSGGGRDRGNLEFAIDAKKDQSRNAASTKQEKDTRCASGREREWQHIRFREPRQAALLLPICLVVGSL